MDIMIENGDLAVDSCGVPIEIYSIDEACQRVKLILSTVRGSFMYNRELGADFSNLMRAEDADKQARLLCREAIADQNEIDIGNVSVKQVSFSKIRLDVEVLFNGQSKNTEVFLNANL